MLLYCKHCPLHSHSRSLLCVSHDQHLFTLAYWTPPFACSLKSESGLISQTRLAIPLACIVPLPLAGFASSFSTPRANFTRFATYLLIPSPLARDYHILCGRIQFPHAISVAVLLSMRTRFRSAIRYALLILYEEQHSRYNSQFFYLGLLLSSLKG